LCKNDIKNARFKDLQKTASKNIVSVAKCNTYAKAEVAGSLKDVLAPLGGIGNFIKPGNRVLLKVNLLRSSAPDKAVTTHPSVVEAAIGLVREAGGTPVVGDSPGGTNSPRQIKKLAETTGIGEVCQRTKTELVIFDRDIVQIKNPEGKLYTSFTVGRAVRDADVVIALPKLKTHGFMKLTGAVKILFGVIPGMEKMQYHLKVPERMDFANMLIDLYLTIKPALTIMDGIVAMEGEGPSGGDPKHIGVLLASEDAVAMDFVASRIIGLNPLDVYTNRAAFDRGLISKPEEVNVVGIRLSDIAVKNFKAPSSDISDKIPPAIANLIKNVVTSKPYLALPDTCTGCGTCQQNCPAKAISIKEHKPQFDYGKCIRCYCCEELCQELSIKRKNHWIIRPFIKR
jgi:uncharacterized protein (DUF362 family)/Pyruvate/2-oxoacid:ferredoxin oxidoreductase delta subunit